MKIEAGAYTLKGHREENQDAYAVTRTRWGVVVAVCDGLGGHEGGREAARIATESVHLLAARAAATETASQFIHRAVSAAHRQVRAEQHGRLAEMQTTIVIWTWEARNPGVCAVGHLGDSRAYLYRPAVGELVQLTKDHSAGRHTVLCTVGAREQDGVPEVKTFACAPGDAFLLCTDGLHSALSSEALAVGLDAKWNPASVTRSLCERALLEGSQDNITAAVIRLVP